MDAMPIAPVHENEREQALGTLVTAFAADPVLRWMYPNAHEYVTRFPTFVAAFGGKAFAEKTAWRLGAFAAVALWLPPGVETDGDAVVAVLLDTTAPQLHEDLLAVLGQMDDAHPRVRQWYLPWFGVDAAVQGQGLGGDLLTHCLTIVDEDRLPAYLETTNPRNISFYERHGFEVGGQAQAGACPPLTFMRRAAR